MSVTVTSRSAENFQQAIHTGQESLISDMAEAHGGSGAAPAPFDLLLGAWGACTNMTLQVYARNKGWPLQQVITTLEKSEDDHQVSIRKKIQVRGELTTEQVERLHRVAEKCPVHQFILGERVERHITSEIEHLPD